MDSFIDRLAEFIRSLNRGDTSGDAARRRTDGPGYVDPDLAEAWKELDDYMRTGKNEEPPRDGREHRRESGPTRPSPDESLRQDYANLEVPFGADMATVRKAYKRLILKYHPDRFAGDPAKQRDALEITKKINESFERIRGRN
ncbi:MAG TPA: J domain-containing protein [Spirochaetia bacterium]